MNASDTKRLSPNIAAQQWRKLKRCATDRDMSVSGVIRDRMTLFE